MPNTIRFHLDENVDSDLAAGPRRRGIDVTTTPEAGLIGATDSMQLEFIRAQRRVMVTHDADWLRINAAGEPHAGIAYCHQQTRSIGENIRKLILIWELLDPADMEGKVEYL